MICLDSKLEGHLCMRAEARDVTGPGLLASGQASAAGALALRGLNCPLLLRAFLHAGLQGCVAQFFLIEY